MKLQELIEWAEEADNRYLEIIDAEKNRVVDKQLNRTKVQEQAGDFYEYLARLAEKGTKKIIVKNKTKTASGWNAKGKPYFFEIAAKHSTTQNLQTVSNQNRSQQSNGLHGASQNYQGLSIPDYIITDLKTKNEDLKKERDEFKSKYEILKSQCDEEEKTQNRLKVYSEMAQQFAPLVIGMIPKNPPAGLASPSADTNLSELKQKLIQTVRKEYVDEKMTSAAYFVINQALNGNQAFVSEFTQLITKHQN